MRPRRSKVSLFINTNWWSLFCGSSIIFFLIHPQAWCIAWVFTRPKVTKSETRDRDVISSRPIPDGDIELSTPSRNRDVRFFQTLETETSPRRSKQVTQLSQRNRDAGGSVLGGWTGGWWHGSDNICTKRCRYQKTKGIDLLHDKSTFIRQTVTLSFEPLYGGLEATYAVHLRLIGKLIVDFLLVTIEVVTLIGLRA